MDSGYARDYHRLHEQHWWWRARQRLVLAELRRSGRGARVLSIGCGDGLLFRELSAFGEVEGVEVDASIVSDDSPWREQIHLCSFDEEFRPGKLYDTVLMLDVLEHLPDPRGALRHALSLLTARGALLVTLPAFQCLWTTHDDLNHHHVRYDQRSFRGLVGDLGRIHSLRYFFHWVFLAKLAVKAKEACVPTVPRSPSVPPSWINRGLYSLSRLEQTLFARVPLPFGGSLFAVITRVQLS